MLPAFRHSIVMFRVASQKRRGLFLIGFRREPAADPGFIDAIFHSGFDDEVQNIERNEVKDDREKMPVMMSPLFVGVVSEFFIISFVQVRLTSVLFS